MAKESITELNKKETSLIEKYIKLKNEEKKNKENIEALKDDVLSLLKEHEGKVVHNGYNISMHENTSYQYSEAIVNIETEIKSLKAKRSNTTDSKRETKTEYIKVYELKKEESK
ncbi:hypothetical protein OFQ52_09610 [Brachyspira hyodysenteriae]|uniref:hypothetical protein n=2 Tax=Brachyspira hyodysenteriae TaxID=159 RepID=UPI0022CDC095|nr:hypothetical protein [Brachyspira hyodysenteriae]MCZ9931030.1 hypothetical protein [Brachyspira hyodysenteriae]